jgi:hypothetical protein
VEANDDVTIQCHVGAAGPRSLVRQGKAAQEAVQDVLATIKGLDCMPGLEQLDLVAAH